MNLLRREILNNHPLRQNDIWQAFDDLFGKELTKKATHNLESFTPAINVKENQDAYIVEAELAGIEKDAINVSIKDGVLYLKGEKKTFKEEGDGTDYHHIERTYGSFHRAIPLAKDADAEKVKADFNNGLLIIEVGKKDHSVDSHRKINIL